MKVIIICTIVVVANAAFLQKIENSECDKWCNFLFNYPVCGVNEKGLYKKYQSDCAMDIDNCKLEIKNETRYVQIPLTVCNAKIAEAIKNIKSNCSLSCPDNYGPVCAYDGHGEYKIFATECTMNAENCNRKRSSEIAYSLVSLKMCVKF